MRLFWIVLDSAGIGHAPDAEKFGDEGSNTWKRCYDSGRLVIPNMRRLGIYNIDGMDCGERTDSPIGCYGRLCEQSQGKDTTTGHWEMAGLVSERPFPTYPDGFPEDVIQEFCQQTGCDILCNKPYSGTEVIRDYGQEHQKTGKLIVYTSADSVFQIAAHKDVVPLEKLYEYCKIARQILVEKHGVARVIARPFIGTYPDYVRTDERHDFSLCPPKDTILDQLLANGKDVIGVGKIYDIFAGKGVKETTPNHGNTKNMQKVSEIQEKDFDGLCYINLVDFDMLYGHRRNISGYTDALNEFDEWLGDFMEQMRPDDMLMITADHGCDPGYAGTDHTRETVPFLGYSALFKQDANIGIRKTYADIAATIADIYHISYVGDGDSFADRIMK